jgi:AcrR family transcriptional regulator
MRQPRLTKTRAAHKPKLRDAHRDMTLGRLKEAARKIFYSKNYDAVSIDEVAAEAGVSRGTVYLHFSSKSELLFDMLYDDLAAQM